MTATALISALLLATTFRVEPGSEVCRFAAGDPRDPLARWLTDGEVTCSLALDQDFPKGLWNVYARKGLDRVSERTVLIDGEKQPARVDFRLVPATAVAGKSPLLVHFKGSSIRHPVAPRVDEALVIEFADGKPIAVAGERQTVLAGIRYDGPTPKSSPTVEIVAGARTFRPSIAPDRHYLDGSLIAFPGVPAGDAALRISGPGWKKQSIPFTIAKGITKAPTVAPAPVSAVRVDWNASMDLEALHKSAGATSCEGEAQRPAVLRAELFACVGLQPSQPLDFMDTTTCTLARGTNLEPRDRGGRIDFTDLEAGSYLVEISYGNLPHIRAAAAVAPFETAALTVPLDFSSLFGHVTVGGADVNSPFVLRFLGGSAVTDAKGEYFAVLRKPVLRDQLIRVRSCDGKLLSSVPAEHDALANARFDIDIPANQLTLEIVDATTHVPLEKAWVRFGVYTDEGQHYFNRRLTNERNETRYTGADGKLVVENLPAEKTIKAWVNREGYDQAEIEPFKFSPENEKTIRVQMRSKPFRGKIIAPGAFTAGQLYWYDAGGNETERVEIAADGTFAYSKAHGPEETITVVSSNLPLWITTTPVLTADKSLDLRMPIAPIRQFEIAVAPDFRQQTAKIGLQIGALPVPGSALDQHLAIRSLPFVLIDGAPVTVRDILVTGPLIAILGPAPADMPAGWQRLNVFALPQFAALPRKSVPESGRVQFGQDSRDDLKRTNQITALGR